MSRGLLTPLLVILLLVTSNVEGGNFWHISDFHLDYKYVSGGNISNDCHPMSEDLSSSYSESVKDFGDYHCDSPLLLVESALSAMQIISKNSTPDFIVWTGDSSPHWGAQDTGSPNKDYIFNVTRLIFSRLDSMFPGVPVIPALGNHEADPPEQFPTADVNDPIKPEYYDQLWSDGAFGDHIRDTASMQTFKQCGYYTKTVTTAEKNIWRFIVLNTNLYYKDKLSQGEDPCEQMSWMNETLRGAKNDEKVFIVAHVPPGSFERAAWHYENFNSPANFSVKINKRYVDIVSDPVNAAKISAHLYGHLHTDTFRLFLDQERSSALGVAFLTSSVTPYLQYLGKKVGTNPTIRLIDYSDDTGILTDYHEYSLDINKITSKDGFDDDTTTSTDFDVMPAVPGMEDNDPVTNLALKWTLLYNAQDSFKVKDLTPASMFKAYKVMVEDRESSVFASYFYHNTGGHRTGVCNETCWRGHLCAISNLIVEDVKQCVNSTDPDSFYKLKSPLLLERTMKPLVTESLTKMMTSTERHTNPTVIDHNEDNHRHDSEDDHDKTEDNSFTPPVDTTITSKTTGQKQDFDVRKEKMEVNIYLHFWHFCLCCTKLSRAVNLHLSRSESSHFREH